MELSSGEATYRDLAEDSARWMSSADNLLAAAGLLWQSVQVDLDSRSSAPRDGGDHADITTNHRRSQVVGQCGPITRLHPFLQHASVFLMLSGFAVENALKALRVRQEEGRVTKGASGAVRVSDRLLTHDLHRLAADAGIALSAGERELLARLEAYLVWAGRYPVATSARGQSVVQNLWSADHANVTKFIERVRVAYEAAGGPGEA